MKGTRPRFTHDELVKTVRTVFELELKKHPIREDKNTKFSLIDCLMAGLAIFTFKSPSLLQFDEESRTDETVKKNLKQLFGLKATPCDTQIRTRLDGIEFGLIRQAFRKLFTLLQRGKVLEKFRFMDEYYLIPLDGTGYFSSPTIHCKQCCEKHHRDGSITYYHQVLSAAMVHPDLKIVLPFAPEPIMKHDGTTKNDCERNAAKRWLAAFRTEHPRLKAIITADGLSANGPFIQTLRQYDLHFIIVCKDGDHEYLRNWFNSADAQDAPEFTETEGGILRHYRYMSNVPLNGGEKAPRVNVLQLKETKKGKTTRWLWITDLEVNHDTAKHIATGGRARWKIENETFNTLKNQGYAFEHNFGHGQNNLSFIFACLMLLAFFIDEILQLLSKRFVQARKKLRARYILWEYMRMKLRIFDIPNFETLYEIIIHPPPAITVCAAA